MTITEFVRNLWESDPNGNSSKMDVETARTDLDNFRADGWDLPEDITPESYTEAWNDLLPDEANGV